MTDKMKSMRVDWDQIRMAHDNLLDMVQALSEDLNTLSTRVQKLEFKELESQAMRLTTDPE